MKSPWVTSYNAEPRLKKDIDIVSETFPKIRYTWLRVSEILYVETYVIIEI